MGPPGSGKGSQSKYLTTTYSIPHISTGDMFRQNLKENTPIGLTAKGYIDKGSLVPDIITNEMVKERLKKSDCLNGFLIDGYPRNLNQAKEFTKILDERGWSADAILNITADDELIVSRISGRLVCKGCGTVYHKTNYKTKVEGKCDVCNQKVIIRDDDTEETVRKRLEIYYNETEPIIKYYEKIYPNKVYYIDGNQSIKDTTLEIEKELGDRK